MKTNMGTVDRVIRLVIAAIVAVLYFTGIISGTLGIVLLAFGGILLATSVISFCPIYLALGLKTNKQ